MGRSYILEALSLIGPEEIQILTESAGSRVPLKKAAGEELISWSDAPKKKQSTNEKSKVLNFPSTKKPQPETRKAAFLEEVREYHPEEAQKDANTKEERPNLLTTEIVMWQREMGRESGNALKKMDAATGYQKSTQMYVVKSETVEGKQKIRFASTDGVLVNKKQD